MGWSPEGEIVRLREAGGKVWVCIGYEDSPAGNLSVVGAVDNGKGAKLSSEELKGPVLNRFQSGTSGAIYGGTFGANHAVQYALGARKEQFRTVQVVSDRAGTDFQIPYLTTGDRWTRFAQTFPMKGNFCHQTTTGWRS